MRGPVRREIGEITNVTLENVTAEGPYEPYPCVLICYFDYKDNNYLQYPWIFSTTANKDESLKESGRNTPWQLSSNVFGLKDKPLKNITLRNLHFKIVGGVTEYEKEVPDVAPEYPEIMVYGWTLPAKGIYFRHIKGLKLEDVTVESYMPDVRENFVFEDVEFA